MNVSALVAAATAHSQIGSPLYRVVPHHAPALVAAALVPVALWLTARRGDTGGRIAAPLVDGYRRLPAQNRLLVWLLLVTAVVHVGLIPGEERPVLRLLFALDAAALLVVARRLVLGRRWRLLCALLLLGSVLAYGVAVVASEPPDQVGLATKIVELAALAVVLRPARPTRRRRLGASTATVALVLIAGVTAWAGAFAAASRGAHGHHGLAPAPGMAMTPAPEREPTPAERGAADRFYRRAAAALRRYRDPAVAAADGYQVSGIVGTDFHAANPSYAADRRIFDPVRPENLIYAQTPRGPVLLGAMYEMPSIGRLGPTIGGPLTEWHAHEHVCFSFVPPALSGLESPFGGCAAGSIDIPTTPEMIHLWVIPGMATRFGDLPDKQRAAYVASFRGK